ncbi:ABC transporter permease, partial [Candidatus Shapirobacteria bacterium]
VSIGFLLATVSAVPLALMSVYFKFVFKVIYPATQLLRHIPPIAWIPLSILFLGLGDRSSYFIVFMGAFFPLFINTFNGARSLPVIYRQTCRSFKITGVTYLQKILFFYSLPYIFTGMKVALGMAWMSVIAAELVGAQEGLGYFIQINRLLLKSENVVTGMIFIALVGYGLDNILEKLRSLLIPWENDKN